MEYLHNKKEEFREAIELGAYQKGIAPDVVEKDYYVTVILKELSKRIPYIVFKGGTSLSKCHKVINRFSEDIDITIDTSLSQGQKKKLKYAIVEISEQLGMKIQNIEKTRSRRDYNRYEITYDTVLPVIDETVVPVVIVETSFISVSFPTIELPISSLIGEMLEYEAPDLIERYQLSPFIMKVQGIDRTLIDKVFAICDYYLSNKVRKHSRHIYDIYKLLPLVSQDDDFKKLVKEVRFFRAKSKTCLSAQPGIDVPMLLRKIVYEEVYRTDYEQLTSKLLDKFISYDTVITAVESIINSGMFDE